MKRWIAILTLSSMFIQGFGEDDINQYRKETDALWRRGAGAEDGAFTATSLSMLGWGLGLAAGIGILASVLHQSTAASHNHSTGHCSP